MTLEERLVGLGLHAVGSTPTTLTFTREELASFLGMLDRALGHDEEERDAEQEAHDAEQAAHAQRYAEDLAFAGEAPPAPRALRASR